MSLIVKLKDYMNFSDSEISVAKYITQNLKSIKTINASHIAKSTYTSNSTVTRLCKKLGFDNFQEFKLQLLEEVILLNEQETVFKDNDIDKDLNTHDIIEKINNLNIFSLQETKLLQDTENINNIVKEIEKKEILDLYGQGASYIVCLDCQYKFNRLGKICNLFNGKDQMYIQAVNSDKKHIAILVSYSGLTKEIIDVAKILQDKGVTTISITKNSENILSKLCTYNLYVTSKEQLERSAAIFSRTSMLNVIDILYVTYFNRNYEKSIKKIIDTHIKK